MPRVIPSFMLLSLLACTREKTAARPVPGPIAASPSPSPAPSPLPSVSAAPDAGALTDASTADAATVLRCVDGEMVAEQVSPEWVGLPGAPPDLGPPNPGFLGGSTAGSPIMPGNARGSVTSTKGFTEAQADGAICPTLKPMGACISALAEKRKAGVLNFDEFDITVVSGAVKSVTPVTGTAMGGTDLDARKCATDALKKASFPSGSGVVRYDISLSAHYSKPASGPKMIEVSPKIPKGLPPEVIRRVVRANFPRFRACYQQALKKDPGVAGVVSVSFTIDKTGAVASAALEEKASTVYDLQMKSCVLGVYKTLSFPEPEGVTSMTVVYPIDFKPE